MAADLVLGDKARRAIKKLFDIGISVEQLKEAATNCQESVDRGDEEWLKTPMMISSFFSEKRGKLRHSRSHSAGTRPSQQSSPTCLARRPNSSARPGTRQVGLDSGILFS